MRIQTYKQLKAIGSIRRFLIWIPAYAGMTAVVDFVGKYVSFSASFGFWFGFPPARE
ncbi:MAG: hypothetical protein LBQ52_10280 [Helicobacteraceae bacterium]|nr:hypothetical protein [Helicobacteraceae bacterium]